MWESENQDESPLMTTDNFHGIDRLDVETIRKCRSLANRKGQSVSSLIRYLVCAAYEKATAAKREERAIEDC
jgi:hypothetical protein